MVCWLVFTQVINNDRKEGGWISGVTAMFILGIYHVELIYMTPGKRWQKNVTASGQVTDRRRALHITNTGLMPTATSTEKTSQDGPEAPSSGQGERAELKQCLRGKGEMSRRWVQIPSPLSQISQEKFIPKFSLYTLELWSMADLGYSCHRGTLEF